MLASRSCICVQNPGDGSCLDHGSQFVAVKSCVERRPNVILAFSSVRQDSVVVELLQLVDTASVRASLQES